MIVLDEVQLIKHRGKDADNLRSFALTGLLSKPPTSKVLCMSATPVINDLTEGVSLNRTLSLGPHLDAPCLLVLFSREYHRVVRRYSSCCSAHFPGRLPKVPLTRRLSPRTLHKTQPRICGTTRALGNE
jgi:hypothetical protein